MGSNKAWAKFEIEYLKNHWGISTLTSISRELGRTKVAVFLKAKRKGLGAITQADEYMTVNQVSILLNVDWHTVKRWIKKHNLRAKRKIMLFKKRFWLIRYGDLCKWLKNNQDRFDSRRIELFALGYEPQWLTEKRLRDKGLPKNRLKKWTDLEEQRVIVNYKDMNYREIAQLMDRSYLSIEHKVNRLRCQSKLLERVG